MALVHRRLEEMAIAAGRPRPPSSPPGTGKTLPARAMAGEAGVPFLDLRGAIAEPAWAAATTSASRRSSSSPWKGEIDDEMGRIVKSAHR